MAQPISYSPFNSLSNYFSENSAEIPAKLKTLASRLSFGPNYIQLDSTLIVPVGSKCTFSPNITKVEEIANDKFTELFNRLSGTWSKINEGLQKEQAALQLKASAQAAMQNSLKNYNTSLQNQNLALEKQKTALQQVADANARYQALEAQKQQLLALLQAKKAAATNTAVTAQG